MRTSKRCPKCSHDRVLLISQVPDRGDMNSIRALDIATVITGKKTFMGDDKLGTAGELSAVVCRKCGYAELYVSEPDAIQIDGKYVQELT